MFGTANETRLEFTTLAARDWFSNAKEICKPLEGVF